MTTDSILLSAIRQEETGEYFSAYLYENGIVEIEWHHTLDFVEVKHLEEVKSYLKKLGGGKKVPVYFHPHEFLKSDHAANKYAVSKEFTEYSLAHAVLADSLAHRITMNFFSRFYKPIVPTKGLKNKESAFEWLLQQNHP